MIIKSIKQTFEIITKASGCHWFHLLVAFFLITLVCLKKDLNDWIFESNIGQFLVFAHSVISKNYDLSILISVLLLVLSVKIVIEINNRDFSLFLFCTIIWIFWEATTNEGWLDLPTFASMLSCKGIIISLCAICFMLELVHFIAAYQYLGEQIYSQANSVIPFHNDAPSQEDKLERTHYAQILIDKIGQTFLTGQLKNAAFNILINEEYGHGKSTFLHSIEKAVEDQFIIVKYKPWLCDTPGQMTNEYFIVLREQIARYNANADSKVSTYMRSLSYIENEWTSWLKPFATTSIWKSNDSLTKVMAKLPKPIIVLIDDVDRLQSDEIFALFRLLRNSADFPNIVHIVAAQKTYIEGQLNNAGIDNPALFLKKFFNYEMLLPANDNLLKKIIDEDIRSLLSKRYANVIDTAIADIRQIPYFYRCFENIRDWKRYYNIVTLCFDVLLKEGNDQEIFISDVFALALIQHIRPDIYKQLRNQDSPLLYISKNSDRVFELAKDVQDLINRKEPHNIIKEIIANHNQTIASKKEEQKEKEEKAKNIHCINDFLKQEMITEDLLACKILEHLFPATVHVGPRNRIAYCDNFFKYFSGKLKENQLSNREAVYIFTKADDSECSTKLSELINKGKEESILHKIYFILENRNIYSVDRFVFLQRVLTFIDILASKSVSNKLTKPQALSIVFERYKLYYIFTNLYYQKDKTEILIEEEENELKTFLQNDNRYALILLLLKSFVNYNYEESLITWNFCERVAKEVWNGIVTNIINKDCFSDDAIDIYTICVNLNTYLLKDLLYQYIVDSKDHLHWLFNCCKQNGDKADICWNTKFKQAIMPLPSDRDDLPNKLLVRYPEEGNLINDFKELIRYPDLEQINTNGHIFLQQYIKNE